MPGVAPAGYWSGIALTAALPTLRYWDGLALQTRLLGALPMLTVSFCLTAALIGVLLA